MKTGFKLQNICSKVILKNLAFDLILTRISEELFLNFIDEPVDSARSLDSDSPIHQDYVIEGMIT